MSLNFLQDFFKKTIAVACGAGAGNIYVTTKPTVSNGYLVISPSNVTLREIIKYTGTGTDATGDYVTVAVAGDRGLGGTTAQAHSVGESIRMNLTSSHWADMIADFTQLQSDLASAVVSGAADSSTTVKGIGVLSVAPDVTIGVCAITIATPAVVSFTAHGLIAGDSVKFSTTGTLPTGIVAGTKYYVIASGLGANNFQISATFNGTALNTSGSQSGVHTLVKTTPKFVGDNDPRVPNTNSAQFLSAVTGMICMYGSVTPPAGFLLCDGSSYSFSTYPSLFTVLGINYGLDAGVTGGTANTVTDTIDFTAHGYTNGQRLYFSGLTMPAPLAINTPYFVVNAATNTFQVALTVGGAAIDLTTVGTVLRVHSQFRVPNLSSRFPLGYSTGTPTATIEFLSSDVNTGTDVITVPSNNLLYDGDVVRVSNVGGSLPTGLVAATDYYVIRLSATTIKLASTLANALGAGGNGASGTVTGIDLTATGTGINTITANLTARPVGEKGGEEKRTLSIAELASHNHTYVKTSGGGATGITQSTDNGIGSSTVIQPTGGNTPHNIMSPYSVVNYIIKT